MTDKEWNDYCDKRGFNPEFKHSDAKPDDLNFWTKKMFEDAIQFQPKKNVIWVDGRNVKHIPMFEGRPERQTIITQDDITNLVINLGIANDVMEVIALC